MPNRYRSIDARAVIGTLETLQKRILERFPNRGISQVCAELLDLARHSAVRAQQLRKPYIWVRAGVGAFLAAGAFGLISLFAKVKLPALTLMSAVQNDQSALSNLFQGMEALVNMTLVLGAGMFFLLRYEERAKRRAALSDLHELRSIAHVIDMHQLTKDPTTLLNPERKTASSPKDEMDAFLLVRYLDYCSELLSITAKIGALYAENARDPVVIESVSDLEAMTSNQARKIWQKITIVKTMSVSGADS